MAAEIIELWDSRQTSGGDDPSISYKYLVYNEPSDVDAETLLLATAPADYRGLVRRDYSLEPLENDMWAGQVEYKLLDSPPERDQGDSYPGSMQGGTGGSTIHADYSLETTQAKAATDYTAATTDHKNAVNVTEDGVEGVDIPSRQFRFTFTKLMADASVTSAYLTTLYGMTGCVNSAAYQPHAKLPTFAAGELLLEDFRFNQRSAETWEFQYFFAGQPNITNLTVGDITGINKKGWEYLWFQFVDDVQNNMKVKRPVRAYVERMLTTANFSGI